MLSINKPKHSGLYNKNYYNYTNYYTNYYNNNYKQYVISHSIKIYSFGGLCSCR